MLGRMTMTSGVSFTARLCALSLEHEQVNSTYSFGAASLRLTCFQIPKVVTQIPPTTAPIPHNTDSSSSDGCLPSGSKKTHTPTRIRSGPRIKGGSFSQGSNHIVVSPLFKSAASTPSAHIPRVPWLTVRTEPTRKRPPATGRSWPTQPLSRSAAQPSRRRTDQRWQSTPIST